jgi:2-polyprenyl-3-methyl-5-hydroxy-6-metoxy-1,4-benzoquinol methylase
MVNVNSRIENSDYFRHRNVDERMYLDFQLPFYIRCRLPCDKNARILDFGCGFGHTARALMGLGYVNVEGYDVEQEAIAYCRRINVRIIDGASEDIFLRKRTFNFIVMSHVLEHIPKPDIVQTLNYVRELLDNDGTLLVAVPNAQSYTGCYWAYEDFTHSTIFTSGSLFYVLSKAGFSSIEFIDKECTEGLSTAKRGIRIIFLRIYQWNLRFWNRVTGSSFHKPSPEIYSYELKAIARR